MRCERRLSSTSPSWCKSWQPANRNEDGISFSSADGFAIRSVRPAIAFDHTGRGEQVARKLSRDSKFNGAGGRGGGGDQPCPHDLLAASGFHWSVESRNP